MRAMRTKRLAGVATALLLVAASCGGDSDADDASDDTPTDETADTTADAADDDTTDDDTDADTGSETTDDGGSAPETTDSSDTPEPAGEGNYGGEISIVLTANPSSLDPVSGSSGLDYSALYPLYDRLINFDAETLDATPGLATSWEYPDPQTLVLTLQDGVTFHDGTPFDAEAVKYNLDRALTLDTSKIVGDLSMIESVEVTDPSTVTINLNRPDSSLLLILADRAGMMLSPTAAEAGDVGTNPVGTGPFSFVEWVPDDHLTVTKNEEYWRDGKPYLDQIEFRFIGDAQTSSSALQAGDVDGILKVSTADVEALENADGIEVYSEPSLLTDGCYFNYSRPPFDDASVRTAFSIAIDREAMNSLFAFGQAIPTSQIFPPGYWAADPSRADTFAYDPERARELLADAGYGDGLSINTITFDASGEIRKMEIIQAQLQEVGIDMTFDVKDPASVAGAFFEELSYDAACASWSGRPDPSQTAGSLYGSDSFYNAGKYSSPGMDDALAAAVASQDQDERAEAFATVIALAQDDALWVPFLHEPDVTALADNIEGLEPNLYGKVDVSFVWLDS